MSLYFLFSCRPPLIASKNKSRQSFACSFNWKSIKSKKEQYPDFLLSRKPIFAKNDPLFFVFVSSSTDSIENWEQPSFLKFGNVLLTSITKTKVLYILYSVTQYSQILPECSFQINLLRSQTLKSNWALAEYRNLIAQ